MRALEGETLLDAWERCHRQPAPACAIALLHAALPESDTSVLAQLPLAERNCQLLELRAISFGRRMDGFAACPNCSAALEFSLDANQVADPMIAAKSHAFPDDGRKHRMRPVNTADLLAAMRGRDGNEMREILLSRTTADYDLAAGDGNIEALLACFESLNASAEIQLAVRCAVCGEVTQLDLDIAQFLARETGVAARRLLGEIHRLAAAYGWSEHSILGMNATRRTAYLAMLDA